VDAARSIYAGIRNPDGTPYASLGYAKGGELGWLRGLVRTERPPGMEGVARNYLRRFADLPEAPRTLADLDFSKLPVRLAPVDALPSFGADGRRIDAFRKAGGKLLLYHSWADDSLTPATAIDVYTAHEQAFGGRAQLDPFFRLFVIPGVFHCRGGAGPDAIDFLDVMVTWVEKKRPPQKLVAFKPARTVPLPGEYRLPLRRDEVLFSRPVYAWPASARYSGSGDPKEAGNWVKR
jgi:feruloyl esterase